MGSVLATNASGSHYLSGSARDTIDSMRIVTCDGEVVELAKHDMVMEEGTAGRLARGVTEIRNQFHALIQERAMRQNIVGLSLRRCG